MTFTVFLDKLSFAILLATTLSQIYDVFKTLKYFFYNMLKNITSWPSTSKNSLMDRNMFLEFF